MTRTDCPQSTLGSQIASFLREAGCSSVEHVSLGDEGPGASGTVFLREMWQADQVREALSQYPERLEVLRTEWQSLVPFTVAGAARSDRP